MAKQIIGKVKITPKGEYQIGRTYDVLDLVTYNNSSYLAKKETTENPTNIEFWQLIAKEGIKGNDATINNKNTINIVAGENIDIQQDEVGNLTINGTAKYDDTEIKEEISERALITETANKIVLEMDDERFVITAKLQDKNDNVISTSEEIDLPLESVVVDANYNDVTKEITLILENGNTTSFSVADLVSGLVSDETFEETLKEYAKQNYVDEELDTRLATDLENIDEAGIERIKEIAGAEGEKVYFMPKTSDKEPFDMNGKPVGIYVAAMQTTSDEQEVIYLKFGDFRISMYTGIERIIRVHTQFDEGKQYDNNTIFVTSHYINSYGAKQNTGIYWNSRYNRLESDGTGTYLLVGTQGDTTINGIKTFNTLPETSKTPTKDTQMINKKYVDDAIANAITTTLESEY